MVYKIIAWHADGPEASWNVSWKVNSVRDESTHEQQAFQSADMILEPIWPPVNFTLRDSGLHIFLEFEEGSRSEIQPVNLGHPVAFEFLLQTLEVSVSNRQKSSRAIKLVVPRGNGNIIRSNILPKRMQDLEYIEKTTAFAQPLQLFADEVCTATTSVVALFKSAVGAIRLHEVSGTQTIDEALAVLESELHNRLSMPLLEAGLQRRTIVFLEGSEVLPYRGACAGQFYAAAESLGIDIVILAAEGHWLQRSDYAHWRKAFIPVECGYDAEFPSRIVAAVKRYAGPIDGILTIYESYHVALSIAAKELGLSYEPTYAYEVATNKYKLSAFEGRNSFMASNAEDAIRIARTEDVPWPIIIKPCRGWASELVFKVDNIEQLRAAAPRMNSERHGAAFVMEHYRGGPEVDINFAMYDGEVVFWDIGDENPKSADSGSDSFLELDYCVPSELPKNEQTIVYQSIVQTLTRLGFRNGIFHCEARVENSAMEWHYTESGTPELVPRPGHDGSSPASWLIEINTRPPGIQSSDIIETTWGVDYWALLLTTKLPNSAERVRALSQPYRQGPQYFADMVFVSADFDKSKKGAWESDNVTEELAQRRPDIAKHLSRHLTFVRKGDKIPHPSTGISKFVAYMNLFSRKSRAEVLDLAAEARKELRIEYS